MTETLASYAVASVQRVVVRCTAHLDGSQVAELDVTGGSVTADARRTKQRDASLQFAPRQDLGLEAAYDLLVTSGLQLQLERGFMLADGTLMAPLGRFVVDVPTYKRTASGAELSVTCSDLSARVSRARWSDPYQIEAGSSLADALNALLLNRWPAVTSAIYAAAIPDVIGAQAVFGAGEASDPWADACGLAAAHGYALLFDPTGAAVLRTEPVLDPSAAVFTFARGATAIMTEATRTSPLERTYNGVIVSGEGSELETPVRGEAWDENPGSATYRYGPFGQVPMFYSSPLITTAEQAEQAARTRLAGVLGRVEQLSWSSVVHPGLQPLDVVGVEGEDATPAYYVIDALTIPLGPGEAMGAVAREITVTY